MELINEDAGDALRKPLGKNRILQDAQGKRLLVGEVEKPVLSFIGLKGV